jgi:hypothetical protein
MMHNVFALVESLSRILQASNRTVTGALEAVQITLREYSKWEPTSILQLFGWKLNRKFLSTVCMP